MMETQAKVAKSFVAINEVKEVQERSKQERDELAVFLQLKNNVFEKKPAIQNSKERVG